MVANDSHPSGTFLAILTLASYWTRLLAHQTPPAKKLGAQMVPVGATANAAYAFISLGYVAGELGGGGGLLGRQAAGSPVGMQGVGESSRKGKHRTWLTACAQD